MKIVFIFDYYYPYIGGAEVVHQKLAEYIAKEHDVTVLTQALNYPLAETINGVKVVRVPTKHRLTFSLEAFSTAKSLLADVDLIQASTYSSAFLAARLRKYTQAKIVLLVHGYLGQLWYELRIPHYRAWAYDFYEKLLFKKNFDHFVAVSEHTKTKLLGLKIPTEKISTIYHGIDKELFSPQSANQALKQKVLGKNATKFICLFSGRPGLMKGLDYLLSSIATLKAQPDIHFLLLIGRQPRASYQKICHFIAKHNLKNITLLDEVTHKDMPQYLALANVVIVPSLSEEFCFAAAEASAMNIPLIATRVGALPEVVSGKVIFIPSKSSESIIAAVMAAKENKFTIIPHKDFSWQWTLQQYDQLYEQLSS